MKSDLHDLKKLTLELMENGSSKVQEPTKSYYKKYMGLKKMIAIDFEEEPRTALMASQTTKKPIKRMTIIIFCRNS
jgi:hypothetical protein